MARSVRGLSLFMTVVCLLSGAVVANDNPDSKPDSNGVEFFESHIRPLLVKRCYGCHSLKSEPIEGGLRLDSRAGWQRGGDSGPAIVPSKPDESRLLKAVLYQDPTLAMPPDNALPKREIELLRQWIAMGAADPRTIESRAGPRVIDFAAAREFWSFQPIVRHVPPEVTKTSWVRSPIDRFVLARLDERGLEPVKRSSRRMLIRRAMLDVLGLPPKPDEVDAFLQDESPEAWPRLVDRLLASPHYGERWGRHWLDVARYADDQLRTEYFYRDLPHAWRYRDWVVDALNRDLPYDQFVMRQIAGDVLVDQHGPETIIATGFLALGMIYSADGDTPEGIAVAKSETLDDRVDTLTRGFLGLTVSCARCHDHKFDPIPTEDYYSLAGVIQNARYLEHAPAAPKDVIARYDQQQAEIARLKAELATAEKAKDTQLIAKLKSALQHKQQSAPPTYAQAHAWVENTQTDMRIALRGNLLKPGPIAPRRFLRVIAGDDRQRFTNGSGRLELAQAIADPKNPLTARVIVNRLWQHHFGQGIVASASNFGALGERPTHPRLLDWLAARLIESGWSLKSIHREIMLSSTYQLSTRFHEANDRIDPGNQWLWRMNRPRLDIETWRDSLLAVSGELDTRLGGTADPDLLTSRRRTIYGAVRRDKQTDSDHLLRLFDFPNPRISSGGRTRTTIPQQQLFALNSQFVIDRARSLAKQTASQDASAIRHVIVRAFARIPSREEIELARLFLDGDALPRDGELSLWEQYCHALLSSNEFLFRP